MGLFFIPFGLFVIIGASNAVNLTMVRWFVRTCDVSSAVIYFNFLCSWKYYFSEYLQIQYIPDVGELSIFCGSVVERHKFLWYNIPPAKIFGRYRFLSLEFAHCHGIVKHEIVLAIIEIICFRNSIKLYKLFPLN